MEDNVIVDHEVMNSAFVAMIKSLLAEKMGMERYNYVNGAFSYVMTMEDCISKKRDTYMLSFDDQSRFLLETIEEGLYPENSILFLSEDAGSALADAAIFGDGFIIPDTEEGLDEF